MRSDRSGGSDGSQGERRAGSRMILAGLGGFLLGAATVLFILWLYRTPAGLGAGAAGTGEAAAPPPVVAAPEEAPVRPSEAPSTPAPPVAETAPPEQGTPGESRPWLQVPSPVPAGDLATRGLLVPVQGIAREQLQNTFGDSRGGGKRTHEALDIMAPRGTPVLAVEDGKIQKLFTSDQGGLTIYQFDPSETYAYYYAHLDRYVQGLKEGQAVRKGQLIGYVGVTGNANPEGPHLHFAIFRLTPEKKWWQGDPLNPFEVLRGGRRPDRDAGEPSR
jgi:murein DD-endopeptidase MepM/ murein hydrolase activator NlpD